MQRQGTHVGVDDLRAHRLHLLPPHSPGPGRRRVHAHHLLDLLDLVLDAANLAAQVRGCHLDVRGGSSCARSKGVTATAQVWTGAQVRTQLAWARRTHRVHFSGSYTSRSSTRSSATFGMKKRNLKLVTRSASRWMMATWLQEKAAIFSYFLQRSKFLQAEAGTRLPGFTRFYRFNLLPNHTRFNLVPTKPGLNQTINCAFGPNLLKPGKTG